MDSRLVSTETVVINEGLGCMVRKTCQRVC